jgi:hypothetical protein
MRAPLAALFLLAAGPLFGQEVERETFAVLGWNDACSVAVQHFGYGTLGEAIQDEPVSTRIGTLSIPPGEEASRTAWAVEWQGAGSWDKAAAKKSLLDLGAAGYKQPGFMEDIRLHREGAPHPFEAAILSTAAFSMRAQFKWPGGDWRWDQVLYSPLGDCGLFIYSRREAGRPFYRYSLRRFYNPSVRIQRAEAHMTDSRLLFEASDLPGALAEAASAAHMRPELAAARYRHAAMLCLSGQLNESVAELAEAARLDAKLARQARDDPDFSEVYDFPGFRTAVGQSPLRLPEDYGDPRR